jgi:hypothetical protein
VSGVSILPQGRANGFPAQARIVLPQGVANAHAGEQAGTPRVMRELRSMSTPVCSARSWSPCGGPVNLPPNPAVERTRRYVTSTWRASARRAAHLVR